MPREWIALHLLRIRVPNLNEVAGNLKVEPAFIAVSG